MLEEQVTLESDDADVCQLVHVCGRFLGDSSIGGIVRIISLLSLFVMVYLSLSDSISKCTFLYFPLTSTGGRSGR